MHIQKGDLNEPEDEERDHSISCDTLRFWNVIFECEKRGPDGAEHDANRIGTVHGLDCEPEDCEDSAGDNGNIGAPEAPRGAGEHGEGSMIWFC